MVNKFEWLPGYHPTAATRKAFSHLMGWGMENTAKALDQQVKAQWKMGRPHIHTDLNSEDAPLLFFKGDPSPYVVDLEVA